MTEAATVELIELLPNGLVSILKARQGINLMSFAFARGEGLHPKKCHSFRSSLGWVYT
ncbi:hypothetical protein UCD39_03270 [Nitrospirillum sp. BR 11752]|uniref:hypothetical protein n=1 Tax=Nitrospirillum sp. BR 11752 TaxID=3104293 RepID=UPI002EB26E96|nr:hypothetical protein [Nitrospirillum sp. BR 11752]